MSDTDTAPRSPPPPSQTSPLPSPLLSALADLELDLDLGFNLQVEVDPHAIDHDNENDSDLSNEWDWDPPFLSALPPPPSPQSPTGKTTRLASGRQHQHRPSTSTSTSTSTSSSSNAASSSSLCTNIQSQRHTSSSFPLLPHVLPSAATAAPAPFAPTAAVIYPHSSSSVSTSFPIPVSAPHAFDAAPTYRLVIEIVTNILAASPRPRALPAGCISAQLVSGRYFFYSPDPALHPRRDSFSVGATRCISNSGSDHNDEDNDEDEFAATDPSRDPRLCTLIIDSWTMVERSSSTLPPLGDDAYDDALTATPNNDPRHPPQRQRASNRPPSPAPRARFESTHEGTAHIACGILHLYREHPVLAPSPPPSSSSTRPPSPSASPTSPASPSDTTVHTASTNLLALLGVPQYLTAADLITWLGPFVDHISHLRMIHDHLPSRYLVLLRFREGSHARAFFSERNGRAFSAFEPQLAIVVKITSLTFTASSVPPFAFPHDVLCVDPAASTSATAATRIPQAPPPPRPLSRPTTAAAPPDAPPAQVVDLHELPTCPVCLERMDASVSGLMTILCQHTFHCGCLRRWDGSACPVCRYTQHADPSGADSPLPPPATTRCATCAGTRDLWACLVCGRIGCGRYAAGHARDHFADSGHAFALELASHRVWDYARDQYVHRLVQAGPDGKLVEVAPQPHHGMAAVREMPTGESPVGSAAAVATPAPPLGSNSNNAYAPPPGYMVVAEADITRINKEYAWLLQSQVDAHRQVLEAQAARLSAWAARVRAHVAHVQRRAARAEAQLARVQAELCEERAVGEGLARANRELKGEVERRDEAVRELEDQVRDLMVFVETREKIERASVEVQEELAGAQVVGVGGGGEGASKGKGKRGKKGKGKGR